MSGAISIDVPAQLGTGNYELARFNALRHGVLSRYTVLPWEDTEEYRSLLEALIAEHEPRGPTEEHLVEELAGVIWRKRRLRLAEAAAHHRALQRAVAPNRETARAAVVHVTEGDDSWSVGDAIRPTPVQTQTDLEDLKADERMTQRSLRILASPSACVYSRAVGAAACGYSGMVGRLPLPGRERLRQRRGALPSRR